MAQNNWLSHNNYRQNVQGTGNKPLAIGDATSGAPMTIDNGAGDCTTAWTLRANLCNRGSAEIAAGMPGTFYQSDPRMGKPPAICTAVLPRALQPGECETLSCDWKNPPQMAADLWFRSNDNGMSGTAIKECEPDNDLLFVPQATCRKIM